MRGDASPLARKVEIEEYFARYRDLLGAEWPAMCEAFSRPLPSTLWIHPKKAKAFDLIAALGADGLHATPIPWIPGGLSLDTTAKLGRRFEFRAGLCHLQESASMLPPLALKPEAGEVVLDLCAAPGGKSAQLSLMMNNRGTLVVNDLSFSRLRALRATQERLGLTNMVLCAQDGQRFLDGHRACFDKVLVDTPCSCEGTLRKRGKWTFNPDQLDFKATLIKTQERLLLNALRLTKSGGRVVYSTCTLNPEENEGVLQSALDVFTEAPLEVERLEWPSLNVKRGLSRWNGREYSEALSGAARVYPHQNDTGGFFIASIRVGRRLSSSKQPSNPTANWSKMTDQPPAESARLLSWLESYYGIDISALDHLSLIQGNRRYASAVSLDLKCPPIHFEVAGIPAIYTRRRVPHLTTASALAWGHLAQRQVVELSSPERVDAYYKGHDLALSEHEARALTTGDCVIRYKGISIGGGFCRNTHGALSLQSLYPKANRLSPSASAFEGPFKS